MDRSKNIQEVGLVFVGPPPCPANSTLQNTNPPCLAPSNFALRANAPTYVPGAHHHQNNSNPPWLQVGDINRPFSVGHPVGVSFSPRMNMGKTVDWNMHPSLQSSQTPKTTDPYHSQHTSIPGVVVPTPTPPKIENNQAEPNKNAFPPARSLLSFYPYPESSDSEDEAENADEEDHNNDSDSHRLNANENPPLADNDSGTPFANHSAVPSTPDDMSEAPSSLLCSKEDVMSEAPSSFGTTMSGLESTPGPDEGDLSDLLISMNLAGNLTGPELALGLRVIMGRHGERERAAFSKIVTGNDAVRVKLMLLAFQ